QRHRTRYGDPGAFRRLDDLLRRLIEDPVVESLEPDPNFLSWHMLCTFSRPSPRGPLLTTHLDARTKLLRNGGRHGLVVVKLHGVCRTALRQRTQLRGVTERL